MSTERSHPGRRAGGRVGARAGFTLLELVVALALLAVAILGVAAVTLSSSNLIGVSGERGAAAIAAEAQVEAMVASPFTELLGRYGPGGAAETFDAPGLAPPAGRARVGRVVFLREAATGTDLAMHGADTYFGEALDMNGDGDTLDGPSPDARLHVVALELVYQSRYFSRGVDRVVIPAALARR